ncbi:hypothetical protein [Pseudoteredinibacter isoporae]|uniref:ABC-type transport system involved in multi-copper enzyme maturation permease subunit n=1 Tax=Pseudoteredinibacter isoporae TaxID=570281 RepID=A0A7X0JYH6_9GAMM|nr:hypothetical protein [Pseudoteredinibacter isoporae]MBB6523781.1 ABC-type transport system involved in multi-copper enzyme maturation permease subunit [Pseudoteredinibacter isoporae]NHO89301.1 hypothetical protein [Pseudoteredinibacter isoporae]NIB22408.1 hypothetical protein [Pseudoteredinibacter isoporae]
MNTLHAPPSFLRACFLHASYELKRRFSSLKWLLFGGSFVLAWGLVLRYVILASTRLIEEGEENGLSQLILHRLELLQRFDWPSYELAICWYILELFLAPLVMLLSADMLIQDREARRLRFWQARSHRLSIVLGRCLAKAAILASLVGIAVFSTLALTLFRQSGTVEASLGAAIVMCLLLFCLGLPYIALMLLSGLFCSSAIRSLLCAFIGLLLAGWALSFLSNFLSPLGLLDYLLPGTHSPVLDQCSASECLPAIGLPLIQTTWVLLLALWFWRRQDI